MHPFLLRFQNPLTGQPAGITTYSALMFAGVGLGILLGAVLARRRGLSPLDQLAASAIAFGAGLVGGRVLYLLVHGRELVGAGGPAALLAPGGGLIWYGGAVAGAIAFASYARGYRLPLLPMLDVGAPGAALGQAFGRIGCLTAGCCHGSPAPHGFPSITFPPGALAPAGIPLHPVQIYESALLLVLAAVLTLVVLRRRSWAFPGLVAIFYLAGYPSPSWAPCSSCPSQPWPSCIFGAGRSSRRPEAAAIACLLTADRSCLCRGMTRF
ncbi:MAG: prolipoprotein diacylglyceryl transferase [Myxococcota bacterium]